jgi:hypothetical protein
MTTVFEDSLNDQLASVEEEYKAWIFLKLSATAALATVPREFYANALTRIICTMNYDKKGIKFYIKFPFSKQIIRRTYKQLRKAGWVKVETWNWERSLELTFQLPGTEFSIEATYKLDNEFATCVKIPTKIQEVQTTSTRVIESEIICSDDRPDLFEEDTDGNYVYIGEIVEPEVIKEE